MKPIFYWIVAAFFVVAGANHFITPAFYLALMPPYLPAHQLLVDVSGAAEILGGLGVLLPATRRFAGWGLILLLIAVFPANLHAALHGVAGTSVPAWAFWVRLPFQIPMIWGVYAVCIRPAKKSQIAAGQG